MNKGEVWFVSFPLEEDRSKYISRPVVILNIEAEEVLSVKTTRRDPRKKDPFDTPIIHWREAGLDYASTARISKTMLLNRSQFDFRIGTLNPYDLKIIQDIYIALMSQEGYVAKRSS
ncbi:MAG: type II toxin-antitoxin system PemK/MazF family toxin [Desulfuromonadaceae bacterium]